MIYAVIIVVINIAMTSLANYRFDQVAIPEKQT